MSAATHPDIFNQFKVKIAHFETTPIQAYIQANHALGDY